MLRRFACDSLIPFFLLCLFAFATNGCWQTRYATDPGQRSEFADLVRHVEFNRQDEPTAVEAGASTVFVSNGFASEPDAIDRRVGYSVLRIYNPSMAKNPLQVRLYFDNKPPVDLDPLSLDARSNKYIYFLPQDWSEHFTDAKAWGARFLSEYPVMIDHWLMAGFLPPGAEHQIEDPRFKGGASDTLAKPNADRIWHFGDGLRLEYARSTSGTPFNEFEWYHILNPGLEDASVVMYWYYEDGESDAYSFEVPAERVRIASNLELARPNMAYGIKFVSSVPLVVQCERFASDTRDMKEWGAWLHASRPGITNAELHSWGNKPAPADTE